MVAWRQPQLHYAGNAGQQNRDAWGSTEDESGPKPPAHAPPKWQQAPAAVKREIGAVAKPGESEREAKIRARMEKIRAEAKGGAAATQPPAQTPAAKQPKQVAAPKAPAVTDTAREDVDTKKLERMLPPLEEKVVAAEEEAERVAILAAPLAMEATVELRDLQLTAVKETERAVKAAAGAVAAVRRELQKRQGEVDAFAPMAKESATEELGKLIARVDATQAKLDDHKTARKDHEMALAAEKLFGELNARLSSVEIDCEKAAMMAEPLAKTLQANPEDVSATEIREAKEVLRIAQATLAPTTRLITGKVAGLKGAAHKKMMQLQSRAEAAQAIVDKAQRIADEAQSRAAAAPILKQAVERAASVEDVLVKMRETEGPFLMGIETLPGDEGAALLAKMDTAATLAQSAIADAHKYVSLKLVEVSRLAESAAEAAKAELERVKQQLDDGLDRVRQFQSETTKRKRANLVEVVRGRVEEAEAAVQALKDAGAALEAAAPGELKDALDKGLAAEIEAQSAVASARRELQERQQDLRPLEGGQSDSMKSNSEILRTKVRVNYMEAELGKFRKLAKDIDEKTKVEKTLATVTQGLRDAEEEVDRLAEVSESWPLDNRTPPEDEKAISAAQGKLSSVTVQVERKLQGAQGVELKELRLLFGRLKTAQGKLDRVKAAARKLSKAQATRSVQGVAETVQAAEAKAAELNGYLSSLSSMSLDRLEEMHQASSGAAEFVATAQRALTSAQGDGLMLEAKVEFARLQLRLKAVERKAKAVSEAFTNQFERISAEASEQLRGALREGTLQADGVYDASALFKKLSASGTDVKLAQVVEYVAKQRPELSEEKVKFAFRQLAPHGVGRGGFAGLLAHFVKVVRDITITDAFEIQSARKVRKLEIGELVEVTSESRVDEGLGLSRARCRAVRDGAEGWATMRSNAGTIYLERCAKPLLWCRSSTSLRKQADEDSAVIRDLRPGEVMELIEGPREKRASSDMRVRGISCHEDAAGWLQINDKAGTELAKLSSSVFKCTEAIAMTDVADFEKCAMVRRIDAGEALEQLPEAAVEPAEGGSRRKFRACRDGAEGWVTVQGSQGTQYMRAAQKHYICLQATPVHTGLSADTAVVRVLMPGEAFAAFEEPKPVSGGDCRTLYSVRACTDGSEGWVASTADDEVRRWSARYEVLKAVTLTRTLAANEAAEAIEVVRVLEPGECVDAAEPPTEDKSTGQLRVRCVAVGDMAVGWSTVREGTSATAPLLMAPVGNAIVAADAGGEAAPATPPAHGTKRPLTQAKRDSADGPSKRPKGGGKGKAK